MASVTEHLAERFLRWLTKAICRHQGWFLYPQILLAVACAFYAYSHLKIDSSRNDLVGADKPYHQKFLAFKKEFPTQDDLVVVVESEDKEKNRQMVERLGAKLDAETNLFTHVFYKGELKMLGRKALLMVPENDLRELHKTLTNFAPFLLKFTHATNLNSLFNLINTQFRTAKQEDNAENRTLVNVLPALESIINQTADCLQRPGTPPAPVIEALLGGGKEAEEKMYITFANGQIYLVIAQARTDKLNKEAVVRLRELVGETQSEVPGVNVGLTGEPVLEVDEMAQSQRDTSLATVVSLILVALIFIYGYNETGRPLKATFCLLIGLAFTMAFTTATVGHLNILTITFAPILIGLAIDFGVHLVSRFEEELRHGKSSEEALEMAMVFTGQGIVTGALTTAGAFFAMAGTNFKGIQEMGIICGGGLVICLVPMMTMLPVLLMRERQNVIDHQINEAIDRRARIEKIWLSRPKTTIGITSALCVLAAIPVGKIGFDYNLLNMQSRGLPAVTIQDKLISSSKKSVLFGAVIVNSLAEALAVQARIKSLPVVSTVDLGGIESLTENLTEDQTRKLALVTAIHKELMPIQFLPADKAQVNFPDLNQSLFSLYGYVSLAAMAVAKDDPTLHKQLVSLRDAIGRFRTLLLTGERNVIIEKLGALQRALFDDVQETFQALRDQEGNSRLRIEDLPDGLKSRFLGITGKYVLQVYPKANVWERSAQAEFVNQLLQAIPDSRDPRQPYLTGTPVQLYFYTELLKKSYEEAAMYSLIAIVILVLWHFRSVLCVILALIPVGVGFLWMVGLMYIAGIKFNPANIMTLPLIIGIGVTNGIHILNRFAEERHPGLLARSTGKAVLVSGLTTIAGFGSLILAKHRGIESLGFIMAVGVATCMVAGLTLLPAILNVLIRRGWTIKKPSGDNARSPTGSGGTEVKTSSMKLQ